jgi:hypothetical protein
MEKKLISHSSPILMKLEFFGQIFEKYSNTKFHKNLSSGSRVVPFGQTDVTKLLVFFAVLWTRLKTEAVVIIKIGKHSRATYHVNCEQVQGFVHLICLRHQQIWHNSERQLTYGCLQVSRNIWKEFISQVVKKLFREKPGEFYTDGFEKTFSALAVCYRTRCIMFRKMRYRNKTHILNCILCFVSFWYLLWI